MGLTHYLVNSTAGHAGLGAIHKRFQRTNIKEKKRDGFAYLSNWKQLSAIKKAAVAAIKKLTKKEVKSLVSWQHHRKQLLAG